MMLSSESFFILSTSTAGSSKLQPLHVRLTNLAMPTWPGLERRLSYSLISSFGRSFVRCTISTFI